MGISLEQLTNSVNKVMTKVKDKFVSKEEGKGLSTNDYTNEDKNKIAKIDDIESSIEQVSSQIDEIANLNSVNIITKLESHGKIFDSSNEGSHSAWAFDKLKFDSDIKKFIFFYMAGTKHSYFDTNIYMRTKSTYGEWSNPILVASERDNGYGLTCQSFEILDNGDYILIISKVRTSDSLDIGSFVYKSSDKGQTWNNWKIKINDISIISNDGDLSGLKKLKSGRLIVWGWDVNKKSFVIYSDNSGLTWNYGVIGDGNVYNAFEPAFCELSDGTIIALLRNDATSMDYYYEERPALFSKSLDGGKTWTKPTPSNTIEDMSNNNGCFLYDEKTKTVEFFYCSRFTKEDGYSSVYSCSCNEEEAKNDNFGVQYRIGKGAGYGTNTNRIINDFGYPAIAKSDDGVVLLIYYTGNQESTNFCCMIGAITNICDNTCRNIDWITGESVIYDSLTEIVFYELGNEYTDITGGWISGYDSGEGEISKKTSCLYLKASGSTGIVSKKSYIPANGINVNNLNYIYVKVEITEIEGNSDIAVSLYSKKNPSSVLDGRLSYTKTQEVGISTIKVDVTSYTGIVYPALTASKGETYDGYVIGNIYKVWGE